jgi:carbon monoxide dehydrogenase subunit G
MYAKHFQRTVQVAAPAEEVFAELDDHERLSAHMMRSSMAMGGRSMRFEFDANRGKALGSVIRMVGTVLGLNLQVSETVVERDPPRIKVWKTIGEPRLLVIGRYQMGFKVQPQGEGSTLTVFIDYDLPVSGWRVLGSLLGPSYARWCTNNMAVGAAAAFAKAVDSDA